MPPLPSLAPRKRDVTLRRRDLAVVSIVSAFESETQAVIVRTSPRNEHTILYVLAMMLTLAVVLISVTKLDIVVSGLGQTIPSAGTLYVQPFDKGIVREIMVKVGDVVKKGQLLATLDPTFAAADMTKLEQTIASAQADMDRLDAEKTGQPYHPNGGSQFELLQESIYQQRQSVYHSTVANYDAQIETTQATVNRLKHDADTYSKRLAVNSNLEAIRTELQKMGWGSKLEALTATDARIEIQRLMDYSANEIQEGQHTVDSLKAQRATYIDQWHSDIAQWTANDRATITSAQQDLDKARKAHDLVNVTAPTDAYVLSIGKASVGSVVGTGSPDLGIEPMFTLVPFDAPLEVEMMISPNDTGFIRIGEPVEVKLDAYDFLRYGTARGVLKSVSQDSFTLDQNNQPVAPYFKGRVAITQIKLHDVPPDFHLIPGMTLTADILAGRRTILSYLVEGAMREGSEAMREP